MSPAGSSPSKVLSLLTPLLPWQHACLDLVVPEMFADVWLGVNFYLQGTRGLCPVGELRRWPADLELQMLCFIYLQCR